MSEGEGSPRSWRGFFPSLFRHGRKNVDLTSVTIGKLQDARNKRGIVIDDIVSTGTNATVTVNKEVVEGDGPLVPPS